MAKSRKRVARPVRRTRTKTRTNRRIRRTRTHKRTCTNKRNRSKNRISKKSKSRGGGGTPANGTELTPGEQDKIMNDYKNPLNANLKILNIILSKFKEFIENKTFRFTSKKKYEDLYNEIYKNCYLRIYDSINPYPFREHLNNNTDKVNLTFDDYAKYYYKQNEKVLTCINMIKSKMKKIFI
jgi:hypothetical protein